MGELSDLLSRVEQATGPDRELDYALAEFSEARLLSLYRRLDGDNGWYSETPPIAGAEKIAPASPYTASIDAALALVERMLPRLVFKATRIGDGTGLWQITEAWDADSGTDVVDDMDPMEPRPAALAILAALLRALIAKDSNNG